MLRDQQPELVDAHAHLADPTFDADRAEVLARARAAGVARVVVVGETLSDARRIVELAASHREIAPAAGLYPTHLDADQLEDMTTFIRDHRDRLVAVGEIGLDHWMVKEDQDRDKQREFFVRQARLAADLDLPINVHSRSAGRHVIAALVEAGVRRVLLHAFDARAATARAGVLAGFFFSIPPSVVRSPQKQKLVHALPLDCLLLETDSPVLGPEPGERNEPANIRVALAEVARLKDIDESELAARTTENAVRLFGPSVLEPIS
jgi:TatD DNase family protein